MVDATMRSVLCLCLVFSFLPTPKWLEGHKEYHFVDFDWSSAAGDKVQGVNSSPSVTVLGTPTVPTVLYCTSTVHVEHRRTRETLYV